MQVVEIGRSKSRSGGCDVEFENEQEKVRLSGVDECIAVGFGPFLYKRVHITIKPMED